MFERFGDIHYEAGYYEAEEVEKDKLYLTTHFQAENARNGVESDSL
jgi:hypothetical protein